MKLFKIIFSSYLLFCSQAMAQLGMNEKMANDTIAIQSVLQEIMLRPGKVTRADYNRFWEKTGVTSNTEKERVIASAKKNFIMIQEYTREIWICAEKAWISSKNPPCTKASQILENLKKASPMPEQQELYRLIEKNYADILNSAANKTPLQTPNTTTTTTLTLESIRTYRKSIDESLEKINKVLSVEYVE